MSSTSLTLVPSQIFQSYKPEDFTPDNIEEAVFQSGIHWVIPELKQVPPERVDQYGGVQSIQLPCQLADYLYFIYQNREEMKIDSYLELGTNMGGTFYITTSFLSAINPSFKRSVGLDKKFKPFEFDHFKKKFPCAEFHWVNTLKWEPDQVFDLCLVDSAHEYEHICVEVEKYLPYCRYMAFHDTNSIEDVKRYWNEIKTKYPSWEFHRAYNGDENIMGLGLLRIV